MLVRRIEEAAQTADFGTRFRIATGCCDSVCMRRGREFIDNSLYVPGRFMSVAAMINRINCARKTAPRGIDGITIYGCGVFSYYIDLFQLLKAAHLLSLNTFLYTCLSYHEIAGAYGDICKEIDILVDNCCTRFLSGRYSGFESENKRALYLKNGKPINEDYIEPKNFYKYHALKNDDKIINAEF